jgi:hypothetical protein
MDGAGALGASKTATRAFPGKVDIGFPKRNATNLESRALSGPRRLRFHGQPNRKVL